MEHCAPCKQFVQKVYAFHNKTLKNMLKNHWNSHKR